MDDFNNNEEQNVFEQPIDNSNVVYSQNSNNSNQEENKSFSIVSLCCGIAGLVFCFINSLIAMALQVTAIVFGILGRKKGGKGMGTAGLVCGIVGLVLEVVLIIAIFIIGIGIYSSALNL